MKTDSMPPLTEPLAPQTPVFVDNAPHAVFVRQDNGGPTIQLEDYAGDSLPPVERARVHLVPSSMAEA